MEVSKRLINRLDSGYFSKEANTLVYNQEKISELINTPFSIQAFENQIAQKKKNYNTSHRSIVCDVIEAQYQSASLWNKSVENQVKLLRQENTFTVTTGHQLSVYAGPLFFVYKIIHTVKLAEKLRKDYPKQNFIPVFWMASEDHDFEEIQKINTFHKTFSWESKQEGPVGRFDLMDFQFFKEELANRFENDTEVLDLINRHYKPEDQLSTATLKFVHDLLSDFEFITLDADQPQLKRLFAPVIEQELTSQFSSKGVNVQNEKVDAIGFKQQVTARDINLFYIEKGKRTRIKQHGDNAYIIDEVTYSAAELLAMLKDTPACFSPNVVLRPVYQEFILPNLCYVGGGGEMTYWLQLKGVFEALQLTYPLLQVRNSIQILDTTVHKKLDKLNLDETDLFKNLHQLKKEFVLAQDTTELDFNKMDEVEEVLTQEISNLVDSVDQGLSGYGKSETVKLKKQLEGIKSKLIRHQKKKFDDALNQMDHLFEKTFPNNGLQERTENVLQYLAIYGETRFLDTIYQTIDPLEKDLIILNLKK